MRLGAFVAFALLHAEPALFAPGVVSTADPDFAPSLRPDGRHLFFTSERPGVVASVLEGERPPGDLYRIELDALELPCR
jgi:hypothetical protein